MFSVASLEQLQPKASSWLLESPRGTFNWQNGSVRKQREIEKSVSRTNGRRSGKMQLQQQLYMDPELVPDAMSSDGGTEAWITSYSSLLFTVNSKDIFSGTA